MSATDGENADLLERIKAGDTQALAILFSNYRDRLWRMVNFRLDPRLARRVDADDVLQEAYINASQRIEHFSRDSASSFFIWLRMVVGQTLIDIHRRHLGARRRDARREVPMHGDRWPKATSTSLAIHLVSDLTSPSQAAIRAELVQKAEEALDRMNPIDREVLVLRHFEELTNSEVAEVLGIEQRTASIRYIRALGRLRDVLDHIPGFSQNEDGGT